MVNRLPDNLQAPVLAEVAPERRQAIENNHSATHLMHAALHRVLGDHALQKGQDVDDHRLRFDFSHFQKVTPEEIQRIEDLVNEKIRENIRLEEDRNLPMEEAKAAGAMMLFGEKYGDLVRMITFDENFSRELCGGTHVPATGEIGLFKIVSEGAVAAGIRRIEAITAEKAQAYLRAELAELQEVRELVKSPQHVAKAVAKLLEENRALQKEVDKLTAAKAGNIKDDLLQQVESVGGINFLAARVPLEDSGAIKTLVFQLEQEIDQAFVLIGAVVNDKPQLMLAIDKDLTEARSLHAGNIIRELAKEIRGGGGGQPFFASAGGSDAGGLDRALNKAKELLTDQ